MLPCMTLPSRRTKRSPMCTSIRLRTSRINQLLCTRYPMPLVPTMPQLRQTRACRSPITSSQTISVALTCRNSLSPLSSSLTSRYVHTSRFCNSFGSVILHLPTLAACLRPLTVTSPCVGPEDNALSSKVVSVCWVSPVIDCSV